MSNFDKYAQPPQWALKKFNNGTFEGTDISDVWRIETLTTEFGDVGFGWYFTIDRLWTEDGANGEAMAFANITLYVKRVNEWSKGIQATGGSRALIYAKSKDGVRTNDECYKMAVTDALSVACKYLGFGINIYKGQTEHTKYQMANAYNKDKDNGKAFEQEVKDDEIRHDYKSDEITLEKARAYKTTKGTPFYSLKDDQLQYIIDKSSNPIARKCAILVLEDNKKQLGEELQPIKAEEGLPWD